VCAGPVPFDRFEFVDEVAGLPRGGAVHPRVEAGVRERGEPGVLFGCWFVSVGLEFDDDHDSVSGYDEVGESGAIASGVVVVEDEESEEQAEFDDRCLNVEFLGSSWSADCR